MAVFWFGLGKKIKNIFTKKEADRLYGTITDVNTNKTEIAALKVADTNILSDINNINTRIQEMGTQPITAEQSFSFRYTSNVNLELPATTWTRVVHNGGPTDHQLQDNVIYLMEIGLSKYVAYFSTANIFITLKNSANGITYSFTSGGTSYSFAIKMESGYTIAIYPNVKMYINSITLRSLYVG